MDKKVKSSVFISGNGTNLSYIIKNSRSYNFPINVGLIITNNNKAKGLNIAKKNNIPFIYVPYKNKDYFERICLFELRKKNIKFLCLGGFLKILSDKFIKSFNGKIINIHPSLLPKYKGLNTYKKVLENKEIYSGCTVHYVTKKLDSGKIILQKKFLVAKNETEESLKLKTLNKEYLLYSQSIISIFK